MSRSLVRHRVAVLDVGNVLLGWDLFALYRHVFDREAFEAFRARTGIDAWNRRFDGGVPYAEGIAAMVAASPGDEAAIRALDSRWIETITGPIDANVAVLEALHASGEPVHAITNFSAEKWPLAVAAHPFLDLLDVAVVSGRVGLLKPDPAIYEQLLARTGLDADACVFADDSAANVAGARAVGVHAVHVTPTTDLRASLRALGVPLGPR